MNSVELLTRVAKSAALAMDQDKQFDPGCVQAMVDEWSEAGDNAAMLAAFGLGIVFGSVIGADPNRTMYVLKHVGRVASAELAMEKRMGSDTEVGAVSLPTGGGRGGDERREECGVEGEGVPDEHPSTVAQDISDVKPTGQL